MSVNIFISAFSASGAVLPVPLFSVVVGQLEPFKLATLPYCPTFLTFLSCIEKKLKTRVRAIGAYTCPLRTCVYVAGEGWTVGQPRNDAACTCPTVVIDGRTGPDSRTVTDGVVPRVMQPFPSTGQQCAHALHVGAGSRYRGYNRSGCTSATESSRGCSNAPKRPPTTAAASAC